jgi:hypothetical protein
VPVVVAAGPASMEQANVAVGCAVTDTDIGNPSCAQADANAGEYVSRVDGTPV